MKTLMQMLNESYDSDIRKMELDLMSFGYKVKRHTDIPNAYCLRIDLGDGVEYLPHDLKQYSNSLSGRSNLLMVDVAVGFENGNYMSLIFPHVEESRHLVYHVTSKKWIPSIKENGLMIMRATDNSDNIVKHDTAESFRDRKYKASFVLGEMKDAREVKKMFDFEDPQLITIDARGMVLYRDPMMPEHMDSLISFKTFTPDRIQSVAQM